MIDLQSITTGIYERSSYSIRIDYRQPLSSPDLSASDRQWLDQRLIKMAKQ